MTSTCTYYIVCYFKLLNFFCENSDSIMKRLHQFIFKHYFDFIWGCLISMALNFYSCELLPKPLFLYSYSIFSTPFFSVKVRTFFFYTSTFVLWGMIYIDDFWINSKLFRKIYLWRSNIWKGYIILFLNIKIVYAWLIWTLPNYYK